jgi:ABC-type glycerol-3-phosphate transport system substrate-binding protein
MSEKSLSRRALLKGAAFTAAAGLLAACQPKVVEVTRVVKETVMTEGQERIVKETVVQEKVVEKTVVVEKAKDVKLVRMHSRLGDGQRKVYDARIAALKEDRPDILVNVEEFPEGSATYGPKIASLVAGGAVGDITWNALGTGSFQFLAANKAFAALDEFVNTDKTIDVDDFYPAALKSFRLGPNLEEGQGELFGLPTLAHGVQVVMIYNRDMVEKAGLFAGHG